MLFRIIATANKPIILHSSCNELQLPRDPLICLMRAAERARLASIAIRALSWHDSHPRLPQNWLRMLILDTLATGVLPCKEESC